MNLLKLTHLVLPFFAFGVAGVLLVPGAVTDHCPPCDILALPFRDLRVFNNFQDFAANNNQTPHVRFPGAVGAPMAVWKASVEWGSGPHGDGSGDPTQAILGDGNANFDPSWQGHADGVGNTNANVVSTITCGFPGVFAFTETPITDGWRMRFCEEWNWSDGPGLATSTRIDLQGIATHQFGHALGLGHLPPGSVMAASTVNGNDQRDLTMEDRVAIQQLYGLVLSSKPRIDDAYLDLGRILVVSGINFDPLDNQIWFTNRATTAANSDPRVIVAGVPSSSGGTLVRVRVPPDAGSGDILLQNAGASHGNLSNAFPVAIPHPPSAVAVGIPPSASTPVTEAD